MQVSSFTSYLYLSFDIYGFIEHEKLEDMSRMLDISSLLARLYHIVGPDYTDDRDRTAMQNMSLRQMRRDARRSGMLTVT
jgi:hypothetical protein